MNAKKRKSKKQSAANSKLQHKQLVLYLDRNLGRHLLAGKLRQSGFVVEVHDDHLPIDSPDQEWIELASRENWIAVTKDRNIRYRFAEIDAIKRFNAGVFVVRAKNTTAEDIANMLIKAKKRIERHAKSTSKPFVSGIDRSGKISKYKI